MKINYHNIMTGEISSLRKSGKRPRILIHTCCAPCCTYPLEFLEACFETGLYFYNPNIYPAKEHDRRLSELRKFLKDSGRDENVVLHTEDYSPSDFAGCAAGLENETEGGSRCIKCFEMRLSATAQKARVSGYDCFTTVLTISPHKDPGVINRIGESAAETFGVKYLHSDFKKNEGFKRSVAISTEYGLYRQDYCGCEYSISRHQE